MKTSSSDRPVSICTSPVADPNATCDRCGAYGAFAFADTSLCLQCYTEKGSCCPEFGRDDLWRDRESDNGQTPPGST